MQDRASSQKTKHRLAVVKREYTKREIGTSAAPHYRRLLVVLFALFGFAHTDQALGYSLFKTPTPFQVRAAALLEDGNLRGIRELCKAAIVPQPSTRDQLENNAFANYYLAEAGLTEGFFEDAAEYYSAALELFEHADDEEGMAITSFKLSRTAQLLHDTEGALTHIEKADSLTRSFDLPLLQFEIALYKSTVLSSNSEAYPGLKEALQLAEALGDTSRVLIVLEELAGKYDSENKIDSAIIYYERGIALRRIIGDTIRLKADLHTLGSIYKQTGNYPLAQQLLIDALRFAESGRDSFTIPSLHNEIAEVFVVQQHWEQAHEHVRKSQEILLQRSTSTYEKAIGLKLFGDIYSGQEKPTSAIPKYRQALELFKHLNLPRYKAEIQIRLNTLAPESADQQLVQQYLNEAKKLMGSSQNKLMLLDSKLMLSKLEYNEGNLASAKSLLLDCVRLSREMGIKNRLLEVYELLAELSSQQENYREGYQYLQVYNQLKDQIFQLDRVREVNRLEMQYETEKKDKELAVQKVAIARQKAQIQRHNYQVTLLIIGVALISIIALFLYYVYFKNRQLHKQKITVLKKEQEAYRLRAVIEGEEKERQRMGQELHDGLGTVLATVKMQISGIQKNIPQIKAVSAYQNAEHLIDDACRTVREISHNMMPYILDHYGLEYAIREMCNIFASNQKINIDFIPFGLETPIDDATKITVYRVTQELLKNVTKHAEATEVIVQLTIEDGHLNLVVEDDGKGFDVNNYRTKGIGLENVRSRIAYIDGELAIDSKFGEGSTFTIDIPLKNSLKPTL